MLIQRLILKHKLNNNTTKRSFYNQLNFKKVKLISIRQVELKILVIKFHK